MSEAEFVSGLFIKEPHARAPEFVKGSISIRPKELIEWLEARRDKEWVNLDIKVSRKTGKWYVAVSDWNPEKKAEPKREEPRKPAAKPKGHFDEMNDDIPF